MKPTRKVSVIVFPNEPKQRILIADRLPDIRANTGDKRNGHGQSRKSSYAVARLHPSRTKPPGSPMRRHTTQYNSYPKNKEKKRYRPLEVPVMSRELLAALFRRIIRVVRTLCRVSIAIRRYAINMNDTRVLMDFQGFLKPPSTDNLPSLKADRGDLFFNKHVFSVDSNHRFPVWARKICANPPSTREKGGLKKLQRFLQSHPMFMKFNEKTQSAVVRNCIYNRYDRKRIILNQGDNAEFFYLMMCGSIYVNISHKDANTGVEITKTVDELKGPCAFGGTALMYSSKRTATIVTDSFVEVLLIDCDTFLEYCADVIKEQSQTETLFLNSHETFKTWTPRRLKLLSYDVKCHFYPPQKVIDQDLMNSNYVYFVMEGSVDVFYNSSTDSHSWLHSQKLKRQVGVLGGNRIFAPSACNLKSVAGKNTSFEQPVKVLLISNKATILYIPASRFREVAPKDFMANFDFRSEFDYLSPREYDKERRKAIQWMEYRDATTKKVVKYIYQKEKADLIEPKLINCP